MFQIFAFLAYWLKRVDQHSLHSPFVFDFFTKVISKVPPQNVDIEVLRKTLLKTRTTITVQDFGAGSRVSSKTSKSVSLIAKHSTTPSKFSRFLAETVDHFNYSEIIELGTSLGINTLYLSQNERVRVTTFEGDPSIAQLAENHFNAFKRKNINTITGNIDDTLNQVLQKLEKIDLAYIDANHTYEATLRYFELISRQIHEKSLIVIDDIHWSKDMNRAWNEIKGKAEITLSIDLFEAGLLFFDPKIEKADYILKF